MRIGIEAQRLGRRQKHGMDFVALELIQGLQEIDHDNEYFIFVNSGEELDRIPKADNFTVIVRKGMYAWWEQWTLPKLIEKYRIDVLHCTANTAPLNTTVPLLVTVHDLIYFETHPLLAKGYTSYQRFGNYYRRVIVRSVLNKAKRILTVSQFEASSFARLFPFLDLSKVKVVYNSVGAHFGVVKEEKVKMEVRKRYGLPDRFVLMLGNTDPKKNTRMAIESFLSVLPDLDSRITLVLGDLDPSVLILWFGLEQRRLLEGRLHFTGYLDNRDLPVVLNLAEALYYPSKRESFGIPILEGMASGCPVICSNTSSMPEIGMEAAHYVNPDDIEDMKRGLRTVLNDPDERHRMRTMGLKRVEFFSRKRMAKSVLEHYKEVYDAAI
ncbi:glycosyltransferase [bacterium]|nr:glycosyltransferase [bacterium]